MTRPRHSGRTRFVRAVVLTVTSSALTLTGGPGRSSPVLLAQRASAGSFGTPVPAPPGNINGRPAPGCFVSITSPAWPGEGPDYPCAVVCDGPSARDGINVLKVCLASGPGTYGDVSVHPAYPDRQFAPGLAPEGSTRCQVGTGPRGNPNQGSLWLPRGHPRCGTVTGDPHLRTFDQRLFNLQAAGEFVAAKSLDDEFEVQMRFEPQQSRDSAGGATSPASVTFTTAVAARVGRHRVTIAPGREAPLHIDGEAVDLADGYSLLINDGRSSVVRTSNRYSVVWPDATNLHVDVFRVSLNAFVLPAEPRDGRLIGLLGDADGDPANDFQTPGGSSAGARPDVATLHGAFADGWRVLADHSLFDYAEGETTASFTRRDVPARHVVLGDLAPSVRESAEATCRAAGLIEPELLAECIYDVGFTGENDFAASALSQQAPPMLSRAEPVTDRGTPSDTAVRIEAPSEGLAAHAIEIHIGGAMTRGYWLGFAPAGSANDGQAANPYSARVLGGEPGVVSLVVPASPGDYELRYRETSGDRRVAHRQSFRSVPPTLTIEAEPSVAAGTSINVVVKGDVGEYMTVMVVPVGSPDSASGPSRGLRQGTSSGGSINLRDTSTGAYEIRCVSNHGGSRQVYARRPLTVR